MATKLREKINKQKAEIDSLNLKVDELNSFVENEKQQMKTALETKELEWKKHDEAVKQVHKTEKESLEARIDSLAIELEEKQNQVDRKELKKLAGAFDEQEKINKKDQKVWLVALCVATGVLIVYAIISIFLTAHKPWSDRITYYAIDIILISSVWFCVAQFSESTRLKNDYGNRKTLAQSFHNILNNLAEDQSIRTKFIEKTTDVLCAPIGSSGKEPILTKRILKDVAEIFGATIKH